MIDSDGNVVTTVTTGVKPTLAFAEYIPESATDFLQSELFSKVLVGMFASYIVGCAWIYGLEEPPKKKKKLD